ncbi:MAG TPA: substrate-binding domain-containing protein, partial [Ornithinimicrobium sp.]|nr:substrate-binding domain-containing protein [Ornithinimicrobium sp.]
MLPAAVLAATAALLLAGCGTPPGGAVGSDGLTVLAAASLTDVLADVADLVRAEHPDLRVDLAFAASSTVVQQVEQGAPADVVVLAGPEPLALLDPDLLR